MLPISVVIPSYNEEKNIPDLMASLSGVDEIILFDHNSTDNTASLARDLGATVIVEDSYTEDVTQEDVDEFTRRYGFIPGFKAGDKMPHEQIDNARMFARAKNDWILLIACDERVKWNTEALRPYLTDSNDILSCLFIHSWTPQKKPLDTFMATKLFRRNKTWWQGRLHACVVGHGIQSVPLPEQTMLIEHHQEERAYRASYLPRLEYAYLKDQDTRTLYYLLREYFIYGKYDTCIYFAGVYLKTGYYPREIAKVYSYMALCEWYNGREDTAHALVFQAMKTFPNSKEPYALMAQMSRPQEAVIWRKFVDLVENTRYV